MMKKRYAKLGVFHHDCWYTKAINDFPEMGISEIHHRTKDLANGKQVVTGTFRLHGQTKDKDKLFSSVENNPTVRSVKKVTGGSSPIFSLSWDTDGTAFDRIINAGCDYASYVYSHQGFETFDVIANDFKDMKNILSSAGDVGQVKIFRLGDSFDDTKLGLTPTQLNAIMFALNQGYYTWPRKINLDQLSSLSGKKRRTFQENLRRAEAKAMPKVMDLLFR